VLFAGTYAYLATVANGGSVTSSSGHDICFFSDSGLTTALDWELVEYDPTTGKLEAHIRVGTLSASTDTVFYLGFGDSGITTFQGDVAGTWNSGFALVAHLPNGTTLSANDSTSNANHGTVTNAVAATGKVGGGASFDGSGDSISFGSGASLDTLTTQTIEMWVKRGTVASSSDQHIASKEFDDGSGFGGWWFYIRRDSDGTHGGKLKFGRGWSTSTFQSAIWRASTKLNSTTPWYYCAVTYDAGSTSNDPIFYVNGVAETTTEEQSPSGTLLSDNPYSVKMGEGSYGENDFIGVQDEFRISNVIRSPDWILATYNSINDPSTFYAVTGSTVIEATAASTGTATGTGVAAAVAVAVGTSAGASAGSGVAATIIGAVGSSVGGSTAAGLTAAVGVGVGASTGAATDAAVAAAVSASGASAAGTSTDSGVSGATAGAVAASVGLAAGSGITAATVAALAASAGLSTPAAITGAIAAAVGSSAGSSAALADASDGAAGSDASSSGSSTCTGVGGSIAIATGVSAGVATTSGVAATIVAAVASASSSSSCAASAAAVVGAVGASDSTSAVNGAAVWYHAALAASSGLAVALADAEDGASAVLAAYAITRRTGPRYQITRRTGPRYDITRRTE